MSLGPQSLAINLIQPPDQTFTTSAYQNFFFCFASGEVCESYSPFFNVQNDATLPTLPPNNAPPPSTTYTITKTSAVLALSGVSTISSAPPVVTTPAGLVTVTIPPTGTTTTTPFSEPTSVGNSASSTSVSSKGSGLSKSATEGIAIGVSLGVVFLALIFFFFFRRRCCSNRRQSKHIMLSSNMNTESRDLITESEKDRTRGLPMASITEPQSNSLSSDSLMESPLEGPSLPQNPRHSYDSLNASAPYSGAAAVPPRRRDPPAPIASNNRVSMLSRGVSNATTIPVSPRTMQDGEDNEFEEPYHDEPIYGDARHVPQVYQGSLPAPFLSEPGMSEAEIMRLEEEERRIDAAIAEAERQKK
jgi:hypothetical protein